MTVQFQTSLDANRIFTNIYPGASFTAGTPRYFFLNVI
uniref:Uncharacterized protein n=1 Tax=Anguilla anguilla TaxID=7936 RepID=A0A0E9UWU5_ANGAN